MISELVKGQILTGVGARNIPDHIWRLMFDVGYEAARMGLLFRGGDAHGSDDAFYSGYRRYIEEQSMTIAQASPLVKIFMPSETSPPGHRIRTEQTYRHDDPETWHHCISGPRQTNWLGARLEAADIHPVWDQLDSWSKALHARNIYQVLGQSLAFPSNLVVFFAEPQGRGFVKGGTNTAYRCAIDNEVPTLNLWHEKDRKIVTDWMEIQK